MPEIIECPAPPAIGSRWTSKAGHPGFTVSEVTLVDDEEDDASQKQIQGFWLAVIDFDGSEIGDELNPDEFAEIVKKGAYMAG